MADPTFVEAVIHYHDPREARDGWAMLDLVEPENTTVMTEPHKVTIADARSVRREFSLEANGFVLVEHDPDGLDLLDAEQVSARYYPAVESLIRDMTGAEEVIVFGESLRSDDPAVLAERQDGTNRLAPAGSAHIDYDEQTVRNFVEDIAGPAEAKRLADKRLKLINLWRGVHAVERSPLAVCDAATVRREDFIPCKLRAPLGPALEGRRAGYDVAYSARHRWYYFPRMQPNEILAFKLCDSDHRAVQFTAHTAFTDPTSAPDAPPRVSFEIRTICFFPF